MTQANNESGNLACGADTAECVVPAPALPYVHVNLTRYSETVCVVARCPTCERDRRMLAQFQEWYGWTHTCAGCGEMWSDGEMHERPFSPGWRKHQRNRAIKVLASIGVQA